METRRSMRIAAFGFLQLGFDCPRTERSGGLRPQRASERACVARPRPPARLINVTNSTLFPRPAWKTRPSPSSAPSPECISLELCGPNIEPDHRLQKRTIKCASKLLAEIGNLSSGKCALRFGIPPAVCVVEWAVTCGACAPYYIESGRWCRC